MLLPPTNIQLRPYQVELKAKLRDSFARGNRLVLLQASTGAGKTVSAADIIRSAVEKGSRCVFLAPRRELVYQTREKLDAFGVPAGIIMAGEEYDRDRPVQVCSKDTLVARTMTRDRMELPPCDLLLVDEAHHSMALAFRKLIQKFVDCGAIVLGLSATPARTTGYGMGDLYQDMICAAPTSQLVRDGYLVPIRGYAPYQPDLRGVESSAGDYNKHQLSERMDQPQLTGDVVKHWEKYGENRQTIVFASGIDHSRHLAEQFRARGIVAEHLDERTEPETRKETIARLHDGRVRVVCNVGILTEGTDVPCVSCICLVRPTRSFVLFLQMVGRGMRSHPGKKDLVLIDHAGAVCYHRFFPDQDYEWNLDPGIRIQDKAEKEKKESKEKPPIVCPKCFTLFSKTNVCPSCGFAVERQGREKINESGHLVEVARDVPTIVTRGEQERYWHTCLAIAANKGVKASAAGMMFKSKYKTWPPVDFRNMPRGSQWHQKAGDLFPQYLPAALRPVTEADVPPGLFTEPAPAGATEPVGTTDDWEPLEF